MGIETGTALIIASLIGGGAAAITAEQNRKSASKAKKGGVSQAGQTDARKVTRKDIAKKSARAALVVGSPKGILSKATTTGRGTILGN